MKPSFGMAPLNLLSTDAETEASKGETPCPRLMWRAWGKMALRSLASHYLGKHFWKSALENS